MDKVCSMCGETKPINQFYPHKYCKDGICSYCKKCASEKDKVYRAKNKIKLRATRVIWEQKTKEHRRKYVNSKYRELKDKVIDHYGGKCVICGFDNKLALCIDHVNGNGLKERKSIGVVRMMREIVKNNYPDKYQILCANCNQIKAIEKGEIPVSEIYRR